MRGRRRGVTPANLAERVDQLSQDFAVGFLARTFLPTRLAGLAPSALSDGERAELRELFAGQADHVDEALAILDKLGYGRPPGRRPRSQRAHGQRRSQRVDGLVGKLPRALAKRLPTSPDTHREGRNDGRDIYGPVACSLTLRAGHLGLLAAAGGLWHSRNPHAHPYVEASAGELAQLITGRLRLGGRDIGDLHRLLAELEHLEISATVQQPKDESKPNVALAIPASPVERVERRLPDGRWVDQREYEQALQALCDEQALSVAAADRDSEPGVATVRIHLAGWFREQLARGQSTRIDFRVWARLRPVAQRLYVWLQGTHRDSYDDAIDFYLADPLRYTLGLRGRRHRAAASVRAALRQLYESDLRYNRALKWSVRGRYANTSIPAFRIAPHRRGSAPTDRARSRGKCPAERPAALRGLTLRDARDQIARVRDALSGSLAASARSGIEPAPAVQARRGGVVLSAGP